jgi:hypothetical protein
MWNVIKVKLPNSLRNRFKKKEAIATMGRWRNQANWITSTVAVERRREKVSANEKF